MLGLGQERALILAVSVADVFSVYLLSVLMISSSVCWNMEGRRRIRRV